MLSPLCFAWRARANETDEMDEKKRNEIMQNMNILSIFAET